MSYDVVLVRSVNTALQSFTEVVTVSVVKTIMRILTTIGDAMCMGCVETA